MTTSAASRSHVDDQPHGKPGFDRHRDVIFMATGVLAPDWDAVGDVERNAWREAAFATEFAADMRRDALQEKIDAVTRR